MPTSETILRATFNRLKARLGSGFMASVSKAAILMQEAPDRFKEEWDLLQKEISSEADRLDNDEDIDNEEIPFPQDNSVTSQNRVDKLRAKVAKLTKKIEEIN